MNDARDVFVKVGGYWHRVTADVYLGTTPRGGDDPDEVDNFAVVTSPLVATWAELEELWTRTESAPIDDLRFAVARQLLALRRAQGAR